MTIHAVALALGVCGMAACDERGWVPGGQQTRAEIVGGSPLSSPHSLGHVWVYARRGPPMGGAEKFGSGTLVRPDFVLAAAHSLEQSNCPAAQNPSGNTLATCSFMPGSHHVYLGNELASPASRPVAKIFVHPDYAPAATTKGVDIALLKTTSSFSPTEGGNFFKTLYGGTAQSLITAQSVLSLEAYGCTDANPANCGNPPATAHSATFKPLTLTAAGHYDLQPQGAWSSQQGDSGGPYMMPSSTTEIAAVHHGRNLANQYSDAVPAERFRRWFELVLDPNTLESVNGHANFDAFPEAYFLRRNFVAFGQNWYAFTILFSDGNEYTFTLLPDTGFTVTGSAFIAGDFDDNGIPDILGQVTYLDQGTETTQTFYQGANVSFPPSFVPKTFNLVSDLKQNFSVADFNGDGIDDLQVLDFDSGWADVYYGNASGGLQPGAEYYGLPSALGVDGKFMTVSGPGLATLTFPKVDFQISVPQSQDSFDVQIFDGDLGATNDIAGGGRTCYSLFADGDLDGLPPGWPSAPQYVVQAEGTGFPDHAWKSIYLHPAGQPKHAAALTSAGDHVYTLAVELVDGACGTSGTTVASMNAFSLRANAEILYPADRFQFIAHDAAGDATLVPSAEPMAGVRDTAYDGYFSIPYLLTGAWAAQLLVDADADDLDDALEAAGQFSCGLPLCNPALTDVQAPGVALGANAAIRYDVYGFPLDLSTFDVLGGYENVSGNYTTGGSQDAEGHNFPTNLRPIQLWQWSSVMTHNNVHVWAPKNATQPGYFYLTGGGFRPGLARHADGLHWASSLDAAEWDASGLYVRYLPVTLGVGRNQLQVTDAGMARDILLGTYQPCGEPVAPALSKLLAQALAAKLNVAAGAGVGGSVLLEAKLYGSYLRVEEGVIAGDDNLVLCAPDSRQQDAMQAAAQVLSLVNDGYVDNRWQ